MRLFLATALMVSLAGCGGTPDAPVAEVPATPSVDEWNGSLEPIAFDVPLWSLSGFAGGVRLFTEDGALVCEWELQLGHVNQCLIDGVALVSEASQAGRATMLTGAPPGEFVFEQVILYENMTEAFRFNQTFPAPSIDALVFHNMGACAKTGPMASRAAPTSGRWSVDAVGGMIDATWLAPQFQNSANGGGGQTVEFDFVDGGARMVAQTHILQVSAMEMGIAAEPEIETGASYGPETRNICENVVHDDVVLWPLTFTWTPWHGEPVDLSQDVPFHVWQTLF